MGNAPSLTIRFKIEDFPLAMPPVSPTRYGPVELSYVVRQRKPCNRVINMPYRGKKTSIHNEACDSNQVINGSDFIRVLLPWKLELAASGSRWEAHFKRLAYTAFTGKYVDSPALWNLLVDITVCSYSLTQNLATFPCHFASFCALSLLGYCHVYLC